MDSPPARPSRSYRRALSALAALALALRLFAAWAIPFSVDTGDPNYAPDEREHFLVVLSLARGEAPVWPDAPSIYSVFPPSEYAAQAATYRAARAWGWLGSLQRAPAAEPRFAGIFWARLGSVLLGTLGVFLLAQVVRRATSSERAGLLAGLLGALHPQFVFLGAYCNADVLTVVTGLFVADALVSWAQRGEGKAGIERLGLACGLSLIAKVSGTFILLPAALWCFSALVRGTLPGRAAGRGVACALAVSVPWLAWNGARTGGDPLGTKHYARYLAEVWHPKTLLQIPGGALLFIKATFSSSYGLFGNMSLPLPIPIRLAFGILFLIGILAAILIATRSAKDIPLERKLTLALLCAAAANASFELGKCLFIDFQPQGRYILVTMLLCTSAAMLSPGRIWPRLRTLWPALFVALLAGSALEMEWLIYRIGR